MSSTTTRQQPIEPYTGTQGQTRARTAIYNCQCGYRYAMEVFTSIDVAARADLVQQLLDGNLNRGTCPFCGTHASVDARCVLHEPASKLILYLPESERHAELEARARLLDELARDPGDGLPQYVIDFEVAFGPEGLRTALASQGKAQASMELEARAAQIDALQTQVEAKEQQIALHEQQVVAHEQQVGAMAHDLEGRENTLAQKLAQVDAKYQEVEALRVEMDRQAAELAQQRGHVEEFTRQLEHREQMVASQEQSAETAARFPAEVADQQPAPSPNLFDSASAESSPNLQQSIERGLAQATQPAAETPMEISDADVVEEAEIIAEEAIVEEAPIEPAPQPQPEPQPEPQPAPEPEPTPKPKKAKKAKKAKAARKKKAAGPAGLDDEARATLLGQERKFARLTGDSVELFAVTKDEKMLRDPSKTSVRLRIHHVDDRGGYPWVAITAAVRPPGGKAHLFPWILDYRVRVHRRILGKLSEKCSMHITLADKSVERHAMFTASNRIEGNIKSICSDLEKFLLENPDVDGSEGVDEGYVMGRLLEELKKPMPFHGRYVDEHDTHAAVVSALEDLHTWGSPDRVRRLVRIYSFPLEGIATIKRRIINRAVNAGLDLPGSLPEDAVSMGLADDVPALLGHSLSAFLTLCQGHTDLDEVAIATNWKNLIEAAGRHEVPVSVEVAEMACEYLAGGTVKVPMAQEVEALGKTPVSDLPTDVLMRWLALPSKRAVAAMELLARGESEGIAAITESSVLMAAADLLLLTPKLVELDDVGENFFLDGLKSESALVNVSSAIALAKLKMRGAVVPLINAMCEHDDPVWKVEAIALSRYKGAAMRTVEQFLRNPRGFEDRLVFLAGALSMAGCEKQIKKLSSDSDLGLASLAKKGHDGRHAVQMEIDGMLKEDSADELLEFVRDLDNGLSGH